MKDHFFQVQIAFLAMVGIVAASNYLVQFPLNDWLTWGAFVYPFSFLITELTNRIHGPQMARKVVYAGFLVAAILSLLLATPKIAVASLTAFLVSQLLDIFVFNRLRQAAWWRAPFFASFFASLIDTLLFWQLAFWNESVPLLTWMTGDFAVKFLFDVAMLTPFRLAIRRMSTSLNS